MRSNKNVRGAAAPSPLYCGAMLKIAPQLALLPLCLALSAGPAFAAGKRPVVVELFTSQGCGACTKANALVADLAERKDVLALTFPVDYWDYLGWKDTFARPEFSARQRAYMKAAGQRDVYTPQLVVDGVPETQKGAADGAPELIKTAAHAHAPAPDMRLARGRLSVGSGAVPRGGAEVWLVRYEAQPRETPVKDGENRGVTVVYRNVVTGLTRLGIWSGRPQTYALPKAARSQDGKAAILIQAKTSKRILGVLKP
jgi:hypothetical protein